jgi:hypothetical protein
MTQSTHAKHAAQAAADEAAEASSEVSEFERRTLANYRRHRAVSYDRGVQIAAAKVRVATDKKLGEKTPEWIVELAREENGAAAS